MRSIHQSQRGASAVEFALIAPLFIAVLFAVIEFGLIIYTKEMLTHAGREGARYGIVLCTPRRTEAEIKAKVREYLDLAGLTSSAAVTVTGEGGASGTPLTVTVTYTYKFFLVPNIMNQYFGGTMGNLNLKSVSAMNME
jgi:Flp pilus assembly protein TadG